jgi:hypothetical protein
LSGECIEELNIARRKNSNVCLCMNFAKSFWSPLTCFSGLARSSGSVEVGIYSEIELSLTSPVSNLLVQFCRPLESAVRQCQIVLNSGLGCWFCLPSGTVKPTPASTIASLAMTTAQPANDTLNSTVIFSRFKTSTF